MDKIQELIQSMTDITKELQENILIDIEDIKQANHEKLLDRNDIKQEQMEKLSQYKLDLNSLLVEHIQAGRDANIYKASVDSLEEELKKLYTLNSKLAAIVLPVREMYREIVEEITQQNGGSLLEIKA